MENFKSVEVKWFINKKTRAISNTRKITIQNLYDSKEIDLDLQQIKRLHFLLGKLIETNGDYGRETDYCL